MMYILRILSLSLLIGLFVFQPQISSASVPAQETDKERIGKSIPVQQSPEKFEEDLKSTTQTALHEKFDAFAFLLYNQAARWGFTFLFPWMPLYAIEGASLVTAYVVPHDLFGAYPIIDGHIDGLFKLTPTKKGVDLIRKTKDALSSVTSNLWSLASRGYQSINPGKFSWGFF